jgi:MSHA pilin protein MshA
MQKMMPAIKDQRGFTLIEIIMVIVLLGIIAAIAIPQYVDMKSKAQEATADGIVGSIVSAAAIGYAYNAVNTATATYPSQDDVNTTYLKKGGTDMFDGANLWTATIGAKIFTFTYTQTDGSAGWTDS